MGNPNTQVETVLAVAVPHEVPSPMIGGWRSEGREHDALHQEMATTPPYALGAARLSPVTNNMDPC